MNIGDFSARTRLTEVNLDELISSSDISDKRRLRLIDLRKQFTPGDEVFHYCSEKQEWDAGMGSEGYVLVRNNEIIDDLLVRMN